MAGDRISGQNGLIPQWLKARANLKMFMVIYSLLGTIQAMSFIYITVTLTTLEKRFKIPSQTTGLILSGNEISQVLAIFLVYYGGTGHRPRWIAVGVGCSAISCLVLALPHFIYGPGKDALALTQEYLDQTLLNSTSDSKDIFVCQRTPGSETCDEDSLSDISLVPRLLVFASQFILGIGTTLYYGLGQTYLDDNTEKKNTPMLLGVSFGLRTLGPVAGFILSYFCLRIYINPSLHPVISSKDPRWLGAWWLGWIILGSVMGLFALMVAVFPKDLPRPKKVGLRDGEVPLKLDSLPEGKIVQQLDVIKPVEAKPKQVPTLKEFSKVLKRLLTNRIILFNNISGVFYILGASGFITFFPKFIEVQFGTSSGEGSVLAGPITLFGMVLGFIISGAVISKFKPGARPLLAWNVLVGLCFLSGTIGYIFLACPDRGIVGIDIESTSFNLTFECNADCACEGIKYSPVCHQDTGTTFFSACHAGCKTVLDEHTFGNCTCVSGLKTLRIESDSGMNDLLKGISNSSGILGSQSPELGTRTSQSVIEIYDKVISGPCPRDCSYVYKWFVGISCVVQLVACAGKIGNILVNYRAVAPKDKGVAQGFTLMCISLFALIPGPIIYGAMIDATCIIWDESCGENGNCWYYHKDNFRLYMCATGAGFVFIAVIFDSLVWYFVKDLDLYGATDDDKRREFVKAEIPVVSNEISRPAITGTVNLDRRHEQSS